MICVLEGSVGRMPAWDLLAALELMVSLSFARVGMENGEKMS